MSELVRANKATCYWVGEGVAQVTFYKTHTKLGSVKSDDAKVKELGFQMPQNIPAAEGVEAVEFSPNEKLEAFKGFVTTNAVQFGITYDPVDRRADEYKYPSTYDEVTFGQYAEIALGQALGDAIASVQTNVIDKMVKDGHMPEGATLSFVMGEVGVVPTEVYKNGKLKYATATIPTTLTVSPSEEGFNQDCMINAEVDLVSGQLKKPRNFGTYVMTMTGVKTALVDGNVLPKIEKPAKDETAATDNTPAPSGDEQATA